MSQNAHKMQRVQWSKSRVQSKSARRFASVNETDIEYEQRARTRDHNMHLKSHFQNPYLSQFNATIVWPIKNTPFAMCFGVQLRIGVRLLFIYDFRMNQCIKYIDWKTECRQLSERTRQSTWYRTQDIPFLCRLGFYAPSRYFHMCSCRVESKAQAEHTAYKCQKNEEIETNILPIVYQNGCSMHTRIHI